MTCMGEDPSLSSDCCRPLDFATDWQYFNVFRVLTVSCVKCGYSELNWKGSMKAELWYCSCCVIEPAVVSFASFHRCARVCWAWYVRLVLFAVVRTYSCMQIVCFYSSFLVKNKWTRECRMPVICDQLLQKIYFSCYIWFNEMNSVFLGNQVTSHLFPSLNRPISNISIFYNQTLWRCLNFLLLLV